jgi:hypothetical protein
MSTRSRGVSPSTKRSTRGTQTEAVLPQSASHVISSVISELLALTLQDDVPRAAEWANHAAPRISAVVEDVGVERQLDELLRAILRLKMRAATRQPVRHEQHTRSERDDDSAVLLHLSQLA